MLNLNKRNIFKVFQDIYDDEFIGLINNLNDSIKTYYNVSKYNIKETNDFLLIFEKQWKTMEESLIKLSQKKSIDNISKGINKLRNNTNSNDTNLNIFFEDAKTLFKQMKLKRKDYLINLRKVMRSASYKNN